MEGKFLKEKCAIITGSTSGIGLGIAKTLAKYGCSVVISGSRSEEEGQKIIEEIKNFYKIDAIYCQVDFKEAEKAANKLIQTTIDYFGKIDILVNNAGIQFVSPIENFPSQKWEEIISINLSSSFHTIRLAIPWMKKNKDMWGRIINISSVHGLVASINKSAYVASKHALNGLTKVVALENANTNITCNAICPGWVNTPLVQKQIKALAFEKGLTMEEATSKLLGEKQPSKKFITPEQIGEYVIFLCSEGASNITGSEQIIDGGWTCQ